MATAYKYVEREAENQINWAEVGSNFSNMLNEEARVREDKKAAIDEATREFQKVVANVPLGENTEVNKRTIAFADDLQQQMLMTDTLLKSGQLKPSQYTLMRQNLVDGTEIGFSLYEEYQKEFSKKMALNSDDIPYGERLSKVTLEMMENVEGFSNFTGARLVIDSATGNVAAAKMIKDPNNPDGPLIPDSNPANLMSVSNLRNRIRTTVTNFDVVGAAEDWTDRLAPDVREAVTSMGTGYKAGTIEKVSTYVRKAGGLDGLTDEQIAKKAEELGVSVDDLKSISLFEEASDKWAKSQLQGGTYNAASVLLDFNKATMDGELYTTTYNPDDLLDENGKRKQNILFAKTENGRVVYELTEEQEANAERALKTQARMMLEEEGTVRAQKFKTAPSVTEQRYWSEKKTKGQRAKSLANLLADLYYGDENEIVSAETNLAGANDGIQKISRTPTGVIITYMTGNTSPELSFTDVSGNLKTVEDFIAGAYTSFGREGEDVFAGQDYKTVIRGAGINKSRAFNDETTVERGIKVAESEQEKAVNYIDNLTYDSKTVQTVGDVVNEVKSFVNKIPNLAGLAIDEDYGNFSILDNKNVIGTFTTTKKGLGQAIDALKNYAKSPKKLTEDAAELINIQSKGKGQAAGTGGTGELD
jgi:hypothetical protein